MKIRVLEALLAPLKLEADTPSQRRTVPRRSDAAPTNRSARSPTASSSGRRPVSKAWPFWGSILLASLRSVPEAKGTLFITFDDGPDPHSTPRVLDLLKAHNAKATFFLVANKAQAHPDLARRIRDEGHAIGNHSLDHQYRAFFAGRSAMLSWVREADRALRSLDLEPIGFRPPAGVRTPELHSVLMELQMPLILWRKRFFDTAIRWTPDRAHASLRKTKSGDIILLHDKQRPNRVDDFLVTLARYIDDAHRRGLRCSALTGRTVPTLGML